MSGSGTDQHEAESPQRVVGLLPVGTTASQLKLPNSQFVPVTTAYEAAAEILIAPTVALVVDLRMLRGRHLRLLEIARQNGVEVLGFGSVPAGLSSDDLSAVRLIGLADLPEAIVAISRRREATEPDALGVSTTERPTSVPSTEATEIHPHSEPPKDLRKQLSEHAVDEMLEDSEVSGPFARTVGEADDRPTKKPNERETTPPISPSELLTPEELSALLENEP